ncbi:MAG: phytanoyl-CoA dioxygenase family protein [Pikeienuella sp.]
MLTADQIQFFDKKGYLVVEDVLDQVAGVDPIRTEYAAVLDQVYQEWVSQGRVESVSGFEAQLRTGYAAGCDWFQPLDISLPGDRIEEDTPMHFGPAVFNMVTNQRLLDIVETLIGPEITSNPIQHVRIKPPANLLSGDEVRPHVTFTDWHQDQGVTHDEADNTQMVTVWLAISDATTENGCLQVIPGSHREPLKTHCPAGIQLSIPDSELPKDQAVPTPVKSGGIVVFHPKTAHSSLVNHSDGFRWSFDIRFNVTGQPTGRSHFPEFVAGSRANPDSVLSDWRVWRDMWRQARTRLAEKPHIPIHRWDSDHPVCA